MLFFPLVENEQHWLLVSDVVALCVFRSGDGRIKSNQIMTGEFVLSIAVGQQPR